MAPRKLDGMDKILGAVSSRSGESDFNLGQIICIGIDELKERLGEERWNHSQVLVSQLIEKAIQRYCGPKDMYCRCRDASFLIIFDTSEELEARTAATNVAGFVNRSLFGSSDTQGLSVKSVVHPCRAQTEAAPAAADTPAAFLNALEERVSEIKKKAPEETAPAAADPATSGKAAPQEPQKFESRRNELLDKLGAVQGGEIEFCFVPLWRIGEPSVGSFVCLPTRSAPLSDRPDWGYDVLGTDPDITRIVELDIAALERGLLEMTEHLLSGRECSFAASFHFETLANRKGQEEIFALLKELPHHILARLHAVVTDIPEGVPDTRLSLLTAPLRNHCRKLSAILPMAAIRVQPQNVLAKLRKAGFSGIFLKLTSDSKQDVESAIRFGEAASKTGVEAGVTHIMDEDILIKLAYSNLQWCSGTAIGGPYAEMPAPFRFDASNLESHAADD